MIKKILVLGLGNIARRHIRNLKSLSPALEIAVLRQKSGETMLDTELMPLVSRVFLENKEAYAWKPDGAIVANPTSHHLSGALPLAQMGVSLFMEKPLSNTLAGLEDLEFTLKKNAVVFLMGYNFRFYRPLQVLKQILREGKIGRPIGLSICVGHVLSAWRPQLDYRKCISAQTALGGGVLLELSHEIDYARWLLGEAESVTAEAGKLGDLELDVEDNAEIIIKYRSGAVGNFHLDMLDHARSRSCRVRGTEGTLLWDGISHSVQICTFKNPSWETVLAANPKALDEMYLEEMRHFLKCLSGEAKPAIGFEDGREVLKLVLAAKESNQQKKSIVL